MTLFIALFCSNAPAAESNETHARPDKKIASQTLNEIESLLAGELKSLVLFNKTNFDFIRAVTNIANSVENIEEKSKKIILTTYRSSSKEYKTNCNFVQITVYLGSLRKALDDFKKCGRECNDPELSRIKHNLFHDYSDLQSKVKRCRNYL